MGKMRKIERIRVEETFIDAMIESVVIVNAPPGYGKTTGVKQFINRFEKSCWIDMQEENDSIIQILSFQREKTDYMIIDNVEKRHFTKEVIVFLQRMDSCHAILISSDDLNSLDLKDLQRITTETFAFKYDDIQKLVSLNKISISDMDISKILDYSGGWIKGITILLKDYLLYDKVVVTNHYKELIQNTFYRHMNKEVRYALCYLSEFTEFNIDILLYFHNPEIILSILRKLSAVKWLVIYHDKGTYSLMIPMRVFLTDKIIEYKIDLKAFHYYFAEIYERTNYIEAIRYYEKEHDFEKIIKIIETYPNINFKDFDPQLMKKVYEGIPYELLKQHPYVYLHMIHDYLTTFKNIVFGHELLNDFTGLLNNGYYGSQTRLLQGELCLIKGYAVYNDMRKMCEYIDEAYQLMAPNNSRIASSVMTITYGSPHIMYLYHREPGKFKEVVDIISLHMQKYYEITNFACVGLAQEAEAEYYLETGRYQEAEYTAMEAYYKAKDFNQSSIVITALMTLARVSIACHKSDLYKYAINSMNLEKEKTKSSILKREIDCALAYLHALNNEVALIPKWLKTQQNKNLLNESNTYMYIAYGVIYIKQKEYFHLKVLADILWKIHVQHKHVFGDIYSLIFKVIALENLGSREDAKESFKQLVEIAEQDMIITPLIEVYEELTFYIESYKNTPYMKVLKNKIKEHQQHGKISIFTDRELEVIQCINAGYTRNKTADILKIKESSVSTMLKRIYKKANITNKDELKDFYNRI